MSQIESLHQLRRIQYLCFYDTERKTVPTTCFDVILSAKFAFTPSGGEVGSGESRPKRVAQAPKNSPAREPLNEAQGSILGRLCQNERYNGLCPPKLRVCVHCRESSVFQDDVIFVSTIIEVLKNKELID